MPQQWTIRVCEYSDDASNGLLRIKWLITRPLQQSNRLITITGKAAVFSQRVKSQRVKSSVVQLTNVSVNLTNNVAAEWCPGRTCFPGVALLR